MYIRITSVLHSQNVFILAYTKISPVHLSKSSSGAECLSQSLQNHSAIPARCFDQSSTCPLVSCTCADYRIKDQIEAARTTSPPMFVDAAVPPRVWPASWYWYILLRFFPLLCTADARFVSSWPTHHLVSCKSWLASTGSPCHQQPLREATTN